MTRLKRAGAVGIALLVGGIAWALTPTSAAGLPPAPVTGPFALGINEAVSVPQRLALSSAELERLLRADATRTFDVGARLVRGHTGAFPRISQSELASAPRHRDNADTWVRVVQAAGLEPVLMVSPWPGNQTANATDHYVPDDLDAFRAYVTALVERYDGDGVDDMPGLAGPVRYWEVDNEPDLKFTNAPRGARREVPAGSFCKPEEYARVLVVAAEAIRAASTDARVLNGGIFRPHADNGDTWLRELVAQPGVRASIDILSLHTYADDDGTRLATGITRARAHVPDRPVWVTETSLDGDDLEGQAARLPAVIARAALAGAERVFWHTLADPPPSVRGPMAARTGSLFRTLEGGTVEAKPAATVFRNLATQLARDDLNGAVAESAGVARLRSGAALLYAGEHAAERGGVSLLDGAVLAPGAVARAPAWLK